MKCYENGLFPFVFFSLLVVITGSSSSPRDGWWSDAAVELPGKSIWSMMSMLGHTKIDVLKIDVEGSEFSIFKDLASSKEQNSRPQKRQFLDDKRLPISPVQFSIAI